MSISLDCLLNKPFNSLNSARISWTFWSYCTTSFKLISFSSLSLQPSTLRRLLSCTSGSDEGGLPCFVSWWCLLPLWLNLSRLFYVSFPFQTKDALMQSWGESSLQDHRHRGFFCPNVRSSRGLKASCRSWWWQRHLPAGLLSAMSTSIFVAEAVGSLVSTLSKTRPSYHLLSPNRFWHNSLQMAEPLTPYHLLTEKWKVILSPPGEFQCTNQYSW